MLQKLRNRIAEEKGFTLIELLVVILIIGILAAIALPVFLGQQEKGQDSSAKADVRNAFTQVEACYADSQDYTKCDEATELTKAKTGFDFQNTAITPAGTTGKIAVTGASTTGFVVETYSKSGGLFRITKAAGATTRGCTSGTQSANTAGCNGGSW